MQSVAPEAVGLSPQRLNRIYPVMQKYIDDGKIPGLLTLIARRGKIVHVGCYGLMDVEANKPVQPDTLFHIASMTKPITCAAVMALYEEGHFQLNDPISRFVPTFKDAPVFVQTSEGNFELVRQNREITIRDLLTHTSGITFADNVIPDLASIYRAANLDDDDLRLQARVEQIAKVPLAHQPGTAWHYGASHEVLAYMAEVITGVPWDVLLRERIFAPLGMTDTGFFVPAEKVERLSAVYRHAADDTFELDEAPADSKRIVPNPITSGGGRLVSTALDYVRFAQMMLNGGQLEDARFLSRKSVELMTTNHLAPEVMRSFDVVRLSNGYYTKGYGYGFGVRVLVAPVLNEIIGSVGSYGWAGALNTYYWADPKEQLIGLVWAQMPDLYRYPIERQFMTLTYQAIDD